MDILTTITALGASELAWLLGAVVVLALAAAGVYGLAGVFTPESRVTLNDRNQRQAEEARS